MTARFRGGPADGQDLGSNRCPRYLRVRLAPDGTIDVLHQIDAEARPDDQVSVYRRLGTPHGSADPIGYEFLPGVTGERGAEAWRMQARTLHRGPSRGLAES